MKVIHCLDVCDEGKGVTVLSYCPSLPDEKEEETTLDDGVLWKPAVLAQLPAVIYQVAAMPPCDSALRLTPPIAAPMLQL